MPSPKSFSTLKDGGSRPHFRVRDLQRKGPCQLPVGSGRPDPGKEALRFELCLQASLALVALPCQGGDGPLPQGRQCPQALSPGCLGNREAGRALQPTLSRQAALAVLKVTFFPVACSQTMLTLQATPRVRGPDPQSPLRPQGTVTCAHHGDGTKPLTQSAKPQRERDSVWVTLRGWDVKETARLFSVEKHQQAGDLGRAGCSERH